MPGGEEFADAARRAFGKGSQRQVAAIAGVSQGTIHNMLMGIVPSRRLLTQIADRLALAAELRRDLFRAARYRDPNSDGDPDAALLADRLLEGIEQIARETGKPVPLSLDDFQEPRGTDEDVERLLGRIRARMQ